MLFAITLHEAAHGYVARHFGDMTAHAQGRISLNPLRHIDLVGTIVVPLVILLAVGRQVPVRLGEAGAGELLGAAQAAPAHGAGWRRPGPAANLAMALGWALLLKLAVLLPASGSSAVSRA